MEYWCSGQDPQRTHTEVVRWWVIFVCAGLVFLPLRATWARTITLGSISNKPASEIRRYLPLTGYLAAQLRSEGIDQVKVVVSDGISRMAAMLRQGKVDLLMDSPFPSLAVSHLSGSKLLLRRWMRGQEDYHGLIFTRRDSGLQRLEDLGGRIIAFDDPYSTTGYFLPKLKLEETGFAVVEMEEVSGPVERGEVGYVFSGADENTMVWVLRGKVLVGAIDNNAYADKARGKQELLKVLYRTPPLPRDIVSYRADLAPKLVFRIKKILTEMDQSEEGRKALQDFENTSKFDELPPEVMTALIQFRKYMNEEIGPQ